MQLLKNLKVVDGLQYSLAQKENSIFYARFSFQKLADISQTFKNNELSINKLFNNKLSYEDFFIKSFNETKHSTCRTKIQFVLYNKKIAKENRKLIEDYCK